MKFFECFIRNIYDDDFHVGYFKEKPVAIKFAKKFIREEMSPDNNGFEVWFQEEKLR